MTDKVLNLNLSDYQKRGLYVIFKDGSILELSDERVEKITREYWEDPARIPAEVKKATDFQRCDFCPIKEEGGVCNALRPILPFLEIVDRYVSHDRVIALYKGHRQEIYRLADSSMQAALLYLSTLSLMHHCQAAVPYRKYFYGVNPLMSAKEASARIYMNIFWESKGDKDLVNKIIAEFKAKLTAASRNEMKRLSLICKNDAFINAVVKTQLISEFLALDYDKILEDAFRKIELESVKR
jgi:hypothetical protein